MKYQQSRRQLFYKIKTNVRRLFKKEASFKPFSICLHRIIMAYRAIIFFLIAIIFTFSGADIVNGQSASAVERNTSPQNYKRMNLYYHLGSVELPEGYKGFCTANWIDAWAGYIKSPDDNFSINWSAGLIEQISNKYKDKIVWDKTEETPNSSMRIGSLRADKNKQEIILAKIKYLEFSAVVKTKGDKNMFMEIVRSYQKERCDICRTFPIQAQLSNQ